MRPIRINGQLRFFDPDSLRQLIFICAIDTHEIVRTLQGQQPTCGRKTASSVRIVKRLEELLLKSFKINLGDAPSTWNEI
ncbi:hypothetical protein WK22_00910 [Burkholderia multivorans]|nr:hypothetical protein WK22_00910 [Burkholderia multivorans]